MTPAPGARPHRQATALPAPPRSAPAAASAATGRGRRLSSCLPPPRGRKISRTPPLATRRPAARCVCLSDLSVPGGGGAWGRARGAGAAGWSLTSGPSICRTRKKGVTLLLPTRVVCCWSQWPNWRGTRTCSGALTCPRRPSALKQGRDKQKTAFLKSPLHCLAIA